MNKKIDCTLLPAFAAGGLSEHDHQLFQQHMEQCPECEQAWTTMSIGLDQYRQSGHLALPTEGLARLQNSLGKTSPRKKSGGMLMRFASAAMLALVFFASGFWSGRNSADQPIPTALHLPQVIYKVENIPNLDQLPFTVAMAESIPRVFSLPGTIPR